jgi:hypothetical protein
MWTTFEIAYQLIRAFQSHRSTSTKKMIDRKHPSQFRQSLKASLDAVTSQIFEKWYMYLRLKDFIPELSEDDFVLRVIRMTPDPDHKLFAECRHRNIVFH